MGLRGRVEKLEGRAAAQAGTSEVPQRSRVIERYFHAHENARREIEGREPLPDLPYTEEDREDDRRFLEETIPTYRTLPGWRREEGQQILDHWEQHTRERLEKAKLKGAP